MPENIIAVGFNFPGALVDVVEFSSSRSLLDADIVLIEPEIYSFSGGEELFEGKWLLSKYVSTEVVKASNHWREQIQTILSAGKTVFCFLTEFKDVYVHTGRTEIRGKGKGTRTNIVEPYDNYRFMPVSLGNVVAASGGFIVPSGNLGILANYWKDFQQYSYYEAYLDSQFKETLLVTKSAKKTVGGIFFRAPGWLVILPPLIVQKRRLRDVERWTPEGKKIGHKLLDNIVAISRNLRKSTMRTPPPAWVNSKKYMIPGVQKIAQKINKLRDKIKVINQQIQTEMTEMDELNSAKCLLYEQGHPLELAVMACLKLMGFTAKRIDDGESEFDVVFSSPEGRFLGEVEGKDNSAINIDKLSQLERNIQEDFARDDVDEYANGVLFGNAFRLLPPDERGDFFTKKCLNGAERAKIALVRTPDMFRIFNYLRNNLKDQSFSKRCRETLIGNKGSIVVFPTPPKITRK